jgi:hypothetical protein
MEEPPQIMHRVNNIQLVRMGNSQATTAAFAMLHRIPGVMQAVQNAAMALKRDRMEADLDTDGNDKGKQRRLDEGGAASEGVLPVEDPPVVEVQAPPHAPADPRGKDGRPGQFLEPPSPDRQMPSDAAALERLISARVDEAIQRTLAQDDTILKPPKIPTATKPRAYAPIKLMPKEAKYDLEAILRDIVPKISLPQLLDISPGLRQELKDLLQSTIPRLRKKRAIPLAAFGAPVVTAMAADDMDVSCLYIDSYVNGYKVDLTLVDGGAQIELVSEAVVKAIRCKTYPCKDTAMRLANDAVVPLPCYAWLDVNVSGVLARVKAYVMPIEMSFLMLLSRRWLARVHAVEDHASNRLEIKGMDGIVHTVRGSPAQSTASISIASQQTLARELEEPDEDLPFEDAEAAEQAIDIILDELDHWEDEDQELGSNSGNGSRLR